MTSGEKMLYKLRRGIYYQEKENNWIENFKKEALEELQKYSNEKPTLFRKEKNMDGEKIKILQDDQDGVYADNGIYYTWAEIEIDDNPEYAYIKAKPAPKLIKFKCKPTYNFQSIEFEIEVSEDYLEPMFSLYRRVVEGLISVTPDQPKNGVTAKPASEKQIEIMKKFNIPYQPGISYDQADEKIKESYNRAKNRAY